MTDSDGNEIGKIFVGGLSQATNDDKLRIYFSRLGEIEDSVVMMDNKTGRSRGFGYVKYRHPESVTFVLRSKPHIIDLKEVDVKQCNINMKGKNRRSLKIFVGGISLEHDAESIKQFFEQFGTVTDVNLMMDQSKLRHRGFAFVGFEEENVVKKLITMHYVNINSKQVEIKAMEPPNFTKKISQINDQNLSVSHSFNNTISLPEQSMNISGSFISNCSTPSIWRPSVIQYPQPLAWPTQIMSSGWMGSPQQWNSQWQNHCEHANCPTMAWSLPSNWYHPLPSPEMWPSQSSNWLSATHVANQASVQSIKHHIVIPSNTPPTNDNSGHHILQSWTNGITSLPQTMPSVTAANLNPDSTDFEKKSDLYDNKKVSSAQENQNLCCGFISSNIDQNNQISSTDYCSWLYGPTKESINPNIASHMDPSDSRIPGGGAGDYNHNQNLATSFSYYATRN